MLKPIDMLIENVPNIVAACCVLHNICVLVYENVYYESLVCFEKFAFKSSRYKLLHIALCDLHEFLLREILLPVVDIDPALWPIER